MISPQPTTMPTELAHALPYIRRDRPDAVSRTMGRRDRQRSRILSAQFSSSLFAILLVSLQSYWASRCIPCWTLCSGDSRHSVGLRYQVLHFSLGSHPCGQPRNL